MNKENYRILSPDASFIYGELMYKGKFEYELNDKYYIKHFNNSFDFSLDNIHLQELFEKKNYKPYTNEYGSFIDVIINLTFDKKFKPRKPKEGEEQSNNTLTRKSTFELREYFYENGFDFNKHHYVRYKRSCGSSRQGACLFIREDYYGEMTKWSDAGLTPTIDKASIASWEAYRALSLSSIEDIIDIPLKNILFIKDKEVTFKDKVIVISSNENKEIIAEESENEEITNTIWDGEALIDESLFPEIYKNANKAMILLRNKFFKSCAFRTEIQKFIENNIESMNKLNKECIVFTDDLKDIKMIVTSTSLKFIKFMAGGFTKGNIKTWYDNSGSTFGIVKHDKKTHHFDGRMVETSYQLINTLNLDEKKANALLDNSVKYNMKVWRKTSKELPLALIYHLEKAHTRDNLDSTPDPNDIISRGDIILEVFKKNTDIMRTPYAVDYIDQSVKSIKIALRNGNILIDGTNAVLFGNGAELLCSLKDDFDIKDYLDNPEKRFLQLNTIYSKRFKDKETIVGARSPHITMGNLLVCKNDRNNSFINKYFPNLSKEIVCVNAIGENIQHKLNGCDYDSDTMLLTNDEYVVNAAIENYDKFLVPVCKIKPLENAIDDSLKDLSEEERRLKLLVNLDYTSSNNMIGHIVNASQVLNSVLWDEFNNSDTKEVNKELYKKICILAVLSGVEIDSAKKTFDINIKKYISTINNSENKRPYFFKDTYFERLEEEFRWLIKNSDKETAKKAVEKKNQKKEDFEQNAGRYKTAMNFVYEIPNKRINFKKGKDSEAKTIKFAELFNFEGPDPRGGSYDAKIKEIVEMLREKQEKISDLTSLARLAVDTDNNGTLNIIYNNMNIIKKETIDSLRNLLSYADVFRVNNFRHLINWFDKEKPKKGEARISFFGLDILFNMDEVKDLLKENRPNEELVLDKNGGIELYNFRFSKKPIKPHANQES